MPKVADTSGGGAVTGPMRGVVSVVEAIVDGVTRHWLALALVATGLFLGLAFAAPVLAMAGQDRPAGAIYFLYRATCHQLPQRSWFIGGQAAAYDWATVRAHLGLAETDLLHAFHHPVHDSVLGYQVAFCQRDVATFGGLFVAIAVFGVVRQRRRVPALPFRLYLLALVPLALDGVTQLLGLRESTPLMRTLTGALFGIATALLVLPQIESAFADAIVSRGSRAGPARGADVVDAAGAADCVDDAGGGEHTMGGPSGPPG